MKMENITGFKDYWIQLNQIQEKVIIPDGLGITTTDVDQLNDWYNEFGFEFEEVDDPREGSSAAYNTKDGIIRVRINPMKSSARDIDTLVNHEIIHKIQNIKSSGKMAEINNNKVDKGKELEAKQARAKSQKEYDRLEKQIRDLDFKIKYRNQEEMMAYAYMVVRDRKKHNLKSVKDAEKFLIDWLELKPKDKKLIRKLKNYLKQYWLVRDQL